MLTNWTSTCHSQLSVWDSFHGWYCRCFVF